jgi:aldose 1-epimerase
MRAGQLFEIKSGERQAIVTEQGATLHRVTWAGTELLKFASDDGHAVHGGYGQMLAPWPGRVRNAVYDFDGEHFELAINDRKAGAAIHGWVRWFTWQLQEQAADRVTLGCRVLALPGYPFPLEFEQTYAWQTYGLEIVTTVTNIGARTAPFGWGVHPYFMAGPPRIDDCLLQIDAGKYFGSNDDLSPVLPALPVDGTEFDFRKPRAIGRAHLDVTLTDLARDDEGKVVANLRAPDGGVSVTCKYDEPINYVQLYTGDTLGEHQREGVAIEPYTCAPDAFNNGLGLIRLAPAASVRVRWTISAG